MTRSNHRLQICVRLAADLAIVNAGLIFSLLPQVWLHPRHPLSFLSLWCQVAIFLSVLGPVLFYAAGFYTKGRSYAGKYKALVILQCNALLFSIAALCLYFLRLAPSYPRSSLVLAWIGSSLLLLGARLWSKIWKRAIIQESRLENAHADINPKKILVIGGAGYIGSALLSKLLDRGYYVRVLDCFLYGEEPIQKIMHHPNLEIHRGDFRDVHTVVAAMKDMSSVVHLGGLVGDPACALDEELTIQINLVATRMIAEVAAGNGISRFIFASSCSVYGANDQLLSERSALHPVSLYARSKIASERVLLPFREKGLEPVILRFGTIYGLSGRTRFDLVVNLLAAKAIVDGVITVYGKDQWRPFLHVQDAAQSILSALEASSSAVAASIFNVGCDEQNMTLGQVGQLIQRMVPDATLRCTEENADSRNYRVEFRRIRQALGFQPAWTLESGIQQVVDAIESGSVRSYEETKYSNVKVLSEPAVREHLPVMEDWVSKVLLIPDVVPIQAGTLWQRTQSRSDQSMLESAQEMSESGYEPPPKPVKVPGDRVPGTWPVLVPPLQVAAGDD
jgi:nucleoside-diphosphate-sugar epimerase